MADFNRVKFTLSSFEKSRQQLGMDTTGVVKKAVDGARQAVGDLFAGVAGVFAVLPKSLKEKMEANKITKTTKFADACGILLQLITQINENFANTILDKTLLEGVKISLDGRRTLISFYGDSNVGKSTLLNSIMRDRYLPVSQRSETAASVHIVFHIPLTSENTIYLAEEPMEPEDDKLLQLPKLNEIAVGVKSIRETLEKENKEQRLKDNKQRQRKRFLLSLKQTFGSTEAKFSLVDNPGCDEFSSGLISESIKKAQENSAAFVVITSLDTYTNDDFSEFLKKIFDKNPEVFKQNRLTIVINKMDEALSEQYEESKNTKCSVIDEIYDFLRIKVFNCTESNFPKSSIILLSGIWALRSRLMMKYPDDTKLSKFIHKHINDLYAIDEFAEDSEIKTYSENPPVKNAEILEGCSNIAKLEERIISMTECAWNIWRHKIGSDILEQSEILSKTLKASIPRYNGQISDCTQRVMELHSIIEQCQALYSNIIDESKKCSKSSHQTKLEIWKAFKQAAEEDMKSPENIKIIIVQDVTESLNTFKFSTSDKLSKGKLKPEDRMQDLELLLQGLSKKINNLLSSRNSFVQLSDVYYQKAMTVHSNTIALRSRLSQVLNKIYFGEHYQLAQIPYPKLSGPILDISLDIHGQLGIFKKFLMMIASLFDVKVDGWEEHVQFRAVVNPPNSTEDGVIKNTFSESGEEQWVSVSGKQELVNNSEEVPSSLEDELHHRKSSPNSTADGADATAAALPASANDHTEFFDEDSLFYSSTLRRNSSESRKRSTMTWSSELDLVKDQIRDKVLNQIDNFFDNLEANVIQKFSLQHYDVACTILKHFDASASNDIKECLEELEQKMDAIEELQQSRDVIENYVTKLKYTKEIFEEMCKSIGSAAKV